MLNKLIKINNTIEELISDGVIKKEWSDLELFGLDKFLEDYFEEELDYEELSASITKHKGAIAQCIYDEIEYDGVILEWAYITADNHIILLSDDGKEVYLLLTSSTSLEDFSSSDYKGEENNNFENNFKNGFLCEDDTIWNNEIIKLMITNLQIEEVQNLKKHLNILLKYAEIRELELELEVAS